MSLSGVERRGLWQLLALLLAGLFTVSLFVGSSPVPVFQAALDLAADRPTVTALILSEVRLPRSLIALFAGATLGGVTRLRAYPSSRFNDQAVIYYSAELRLTPEWHPLGEVDWLDFLEIDWWQWVPFVEVGRVAEKWTLNELHTDMKWDVGFGVRAMAKLLVVRIDAAVGDEGAGLQMMVGQPF